MDGGAARKDQTILPTSVVSMDVEELCVTHYDWMKMTGELPMTTRSKPLKTHPPDPIA